MMFKEVPLAVSVHLFQLSITGRRSELLSFSREGRVSPGMKAAVRGIVTFSSLVSDVLIIQHLHRLSADFSQINAPF